MTRSRSSLPFALSLAALALAGCSGSSGSDGKPGPPGPPGVPGDPPPTFTTLTKFDDPPGVNFAVTELSGGSVAGADGAPPHFQIGDTVSLTFSLTKDDGSPWGLSEMSAVTVLVSGPTFNYQRVIAEQADVLASAVKVGENTWTYTFATPIPETYLAPFNDTPSFDAGDGELQGEPLLDGTYTVALSGYWSYTVEGQEYTDVGQADADFLLGDTPTFQAREVVTNGNCNQCHVSLQAHGGVRQDVRQCVLCHTSGAEDLNGAVAGGTPGVSVDFKVMIHKLHSGAHLPSVNGIATHDDGTRNYDAPPQPYQLVGADGVRDFSAVNYPVWPNLTSNLPKDLGYSALTPTQKAQEDKVRSGATACLKCHGDPDGIGPLPAPAEGDLYKLQLNEAACGSCHDDVRWDKPYTANGQTMPPQDELFIACNGCHAEQGDFLATIDAHRHPVDDPVLNKGVVVDVSGLGGGTGAGGSFQAGDAPFLQFTLRNAAGADVPLPGMDSSSAVLNGPTWSQQLITPGAGGDAADIGPYDFAGRLLAASPANKGTMSKVLPTTPAVAETLTVEFSSATSFTVTGSVSGSLGSAALPASPSTNPAGSALSGLVLKSTAVAQDVTVTFSDATHFGVTGSVSGSMGVGTLPAATNCSNRFSSTSGATLSFDIEVGATPFAAGNSVFLRVFKGGAANPALFAIVAGRTSFSGAAPAPDRFHYEVVPAAATYTLTLPMEISAEDLGSGNGAAGQELVAANLPVRFGRQVLREATAAASPTTLAAAAAPYDRFVDVASTAGYTTTAPDNWLVLDPGAAVGAREFLEVALVDGATRLWVRTPVRYAHASGASVLRVTLSFRQEGAASHYTLEPATGTITSVVPFGAGNALVMSYRSDARFGWRRHLGDALQTVYQPPPNDSDTLGAEWGEWTGLPFVDGTYTASLWMGTDLHVAAFGEEQHYRASAVAESAELLYGPSATTIEPHAVLDSAESCNRCHVKPQFHGLDDAGFQSCVQCHSLGGAEDLPQYANSTVPATPGTTIDFRTMLHKIHMGHDLANASTYAVVGSDGTPGNWADVVYPPMPGGTRNCFVCHGLENDNWLEPPDRDHPSGQAPTVHEWASACGSCHAEDSVDAHIAATTAPDGSESCSVCHGRDAEFSVEVMHKPR